MDVKNVSVPRTIFIYISFPNEILNAALQLLWPQLGVYIQHFHTSYHVANNTLAGKDGRLFCATHTGRSRRPSRRQRVQTAKRDSNIPATSFLVSTTHTPNPSSSCVVHVTGRQHSLQVVQTGRSDDVSPPCSSEFGGNKSNPSERVSWSVLVQMSPHCRRQPGPLPSLQTVFYDKDRALQTGRGLTTRAEAPAEATTEVRKHVPLTGAPPPP